MIDVGELGGELDASNNVHTYEIVMEQVTLDKPQVRYKLYNN